jgi:hypothetical protein
MAFTYGLCAYDQVPLAEYNAASGGNYQKVARELLGKLKFDGTRSAYEQDKFVFSCISETNHLPMPSHGTRRIFRNTNCSGIIHLFRIFPIVPEQGVAPESLY